MAALRAISARSAVVSGGLSGSSRFSSGVFLGRAIHARRSFLAPCGVSRGVSPRPDRPVQGRVFGCQKHIWLSRSRYGGGWLCRCLKSFRDPVSGAGSRPPPFSGLERTNSYLVRRRFLLLPASPHLTSL